jgi:hypothetical protein
MSSSPCRLLDGKWAREGFQVVYWLAGLRGTM